jgi:hypothetical protein
VKQFKLFLALFALLLGSFAQAQTTAASATAVTGAAQIPNVCNPSQTAFDNAYWASQPPAVQSLQNLQYAARVTAGTTLAQQGFVIDVPIMIYGWDACLMMSYRQGYGYTWVPSALQPNVTIAPGVSQPGAVAYNPNSPPPGSIKVSINASDYPPFNPPVVAPPTGPPTVLVGPLSFGTTYLTVVGDSSPDGTTYTDARGTFTKHVFATPFGPESYWTKN